MKNEFIPYEKALELKELGFDERCLAFYNGKFLESTDYDFDNGTSKDIGLCIVAPTFSQAFRWFREKYKLVALIDIGMHEFSYKIFKNEKSITPFKEYLDYNGTYEEAELECLKKLIEIVNTKEK
jgi:hypothetical protein